MVTEFIPFGSRINEYFEGCIKKKPLKSYDFKGFNSICLSARGERGTTTFQTSKNQLLPFIYKKSIKSILYKGF